MPNKVPPYLGIRVLADDPRVRGRQEADQRHHQQARVQFLGAIILHKCSEIGIESFPAYLGVDGIA